MRLPSYLNDQWMCLPPACAHELDRLITSRGKPRMFVSDNGTELTSNAVVRWADNSRIAWHYIAPGKPVQNAFLESFNGRLPRGSAGSPWPSMPRPWIRDGLRRCATW